MDVFVTGSASRRLNIGLGRGLVSLLLEDSEIVENSTWGGGGKDDIVGIAGRSASTEEIREVFSEGINVKAFMVEIAPSDRDTGEGMSLARGQP